MQPRSYKFKLRFIGKRCAASVVQRFFMDYTIFNLGCSIVFAEPNIALKPTRLRRAAYLGR